MQSDFTVFREHIAEAWCDGQTTPDPLCATAMQEFFRLKAKEGNSGFAIAYALTLARTNRKRSSTRSRSNVRPHAKIVVLSEEARDEQQRRAFELEACTPGDD